jgi:hypothetical protein
MALVSRSARRGGVGRRWVLIGIVITLFVLLIDASLHSRSPSQQNELATGAWVDRALPLMTASTEQGQQLAGIWSNALQTPPSTLTAQLNQLASGAAATYKQAANLRPPVELAGAAGLLDASLLARSEGVDTVRSALAPILTGTAPTQHSTGSGSGSTGSSSGSTGSGSGSTGSSTTSTATGSGTNSTAAGSGGGSTAVGSGSGSTGSAGSGSTGNGGSATGSAGSGSSGASAATLSAIQTAGNDLQIGDQAYRLFLHSLPNLGVPIPNSAWVANLSPYQAGPAQLFVTTLQNAMSTTPVHQVKIDSVTTSPAPVSTDGNVRVLPDSQAMSVTVVLSNTGNQTEDNLTVTASLAPAEGSASVRDFVSLTPGQSQTVQSMGPLTPPQGVPVTLTVTVTAPPGSSMATVTQTVVFTMPSTTPTSTTTPTPTNTATSGASTTATSG